MEKEQLLQEYLIIQNKIIPRIIDFVFYKRRERKRTNS